MRINSNAGYQEIALDDSDCGDGLSIFMSQSGESQARYRFQVKAVVDQGVFDIGEFYSSPPLATLIPGRLSRMIAGAVCPGATGWRVGINNVNGAIDDTIEVVLASSKCCASQIGVYRVSERYQYISLNGSGSFTVAAGMRITGIAAIGLSGGGTVQIGTDDIITVPEGISVNLEPYALMSAPVNSSINFVNVDWIIEYLESA